MVDAFSNVERDWRWPRGCEAPSFASAFLTTDQVRIERGNRALIRSWYGPVTDRARLDLLGLDAGDFPNVVRFVLASQFDARGTSWDVATAAVTIQSVEQGATESPLFLVGGYPTARWALFAWLEVGSAVPWANLRARLYVDRGGGTAPFVTRATGVAP